MTLEYANTARIAFKALGRNKVRSALTTLGVVIGVGSVIAMIALGSGARAAIDEQIQSTGTNVVYVSAGSSGRGGVRAGSGSVQTLTLEDAWAIRDQVPVVARLSPVVRGRAQAIAGNENWSTSVEGGNEDYLEVRNWPVASGANFTAREVQVADKVCLLGSTVADKLFPGQDPVGQIVRLRNLPFRVLGVLAPKGQGQWGQDQDDLVVAPYTTLQKKLLGITYIQQVMVSATRADTVEAAAQQITWLLRQRHRIQNPEEPWRDASQRPPARAARSDGFTPARSAGGLGDAAQRPPAQEDDFSVRTVEEMAQTRVQLAQTMTGLLMSVASVSLLVGGIGIMNIMLVSVTERTKEIGLRMAVGARTRDILRQFLAEAVTLSVLGGAAGVALGVGASQALTRVLGWPTLIAPTAVLIAFAFAGAVGVFFGYYPARKAASLDPIEALRYE